jgi:hypothetical protein
MRCVRSASSRQPRPARFPCRSGVGTPKEFRCPFTRRKRPSAGRPGPRDAKAELKAAKAYAKAQRPWFKRKRFIDLGPILLIIVISGRVERQHGRDQECV